MTWNERKWKMENILYALVVGSLMYLQTFTRPDISFAIGMLSIYQSNPDIHHWKAAKKVLSYLQGAKDYMLIDKRSNHLELVRYADFNYVGCVDSGKSMFGYVFQLVEGAISWKSAKQSIIAASTMEAEFVARYEATIHTLWLRNFILGLGVVDC
nr:retrovirus-related Pol polyprotein from transposon TNT 1-94 [Tanacetum cinerariifolium]